MDGGVPWVGIVVNPHKVFSAENTELRPESSQLRTRHPASQVVNFR